MKMGMEYDIETNSYLVSNFEEEFRNMKPREYLPVSMDWKRQMMKLERWALFRKTIQALEFFKSINVGTRIVNTVVTPENIGQLPELLEIIYEFCRYLLEISIAISSGRAKMLKNYI